MNKDEIIFYIGIAIATAIEESWHEVQTYIANIVVKVSAYQWLKSLDWKWLASAILISLSVAVWSWWRNKNKKSEEKELPKPKASSKPKVPAKKKE